MPRIPYVSAELDEPAELVKAIRARRGGLLNEADRMILHAPAFAFGWNELATVVRHRLGVSQKLRELAICGVGLLNGADFEFDQHAPQFLKAGGTHAQLEALRDFRSAALNETLFDAGERATMRLTIEMTNDIVVTDDTFNTLHHQLGRADHLVELVGTIAFYNMVSRFLIALDVHTRSPDGIMK